MVKVIFTKTHCIALCKLGHIIQAENLKDFQGTRFYDMVITNYSGKRTKLDDLSEQCGGYGHDPEESIESQQCANCDTWRQVNDGIVEKCPFCGDDEYEIHPLID